MAPEQNSHLIVLNGGSILSFGFNVSNYLLPNGSKTSPMSFQQIISLLHSLPKKYQQEAFHFLEFLQQKAKSEDQASAQAPRKAGLRRGFIRYMAPDFDAPLDDMADYM